MATALDSIKRAMRLIGVYAIGEDPTADESQDGLTALNAMLDSFANDRMTVYAPTLDSITWPGSTQSMTVGPTGTFITTRPVEVLSATYYELNGISYPLVPLTVYEYNDIALKTMASDIPQYIWVQPTYPNISITLFPISGTQITLKLWSNKQIISIPTLTTDLNLPPGYKDFIDYNLAERLAPEFDVQVPPAVAKQAMLTRKAIARTNFISQKLRYPAISLPGNGRFNIYTGLPE